MNKNATLDPARRAGPAGSRETTDSNSNQVDDAIRLVHIIDDDAALGAALSAGLEAHGYRTIYSNSADSGWTTAHQLYPDLILCDINMPGRNGHRFLDDIRRDDDLGSCPFVFMTGNPIFAQPRTGMDLGADDFLVKPFTLETLVSCVAARLRRHGIISQGEAMLVRSLKDSLHTGLPHEFFTPLTGIIGFAEMLDQDGITMTPEECRDSGRNILLSGRRLQRTLRNYLYALDRLAPDSDTPFAVLSAKSVTQLLQQGAAAAAERHTRRADLVMDITGEPIAGGAHELALLIEELTDNAFSFSPPRSVVRIHTERVGQEFKLVVSDSGRGMTRPQLKRLGLFRQIERGKYEQQGLGVGLFIVQQVLRRFGGNLHIDSIKGLGTTCHVTLPIATEKPAA